MKIQRFEEKLKRVPFRIRLDEIGPNGDFLYLGINDHYASDIRTPNHTYWPFVGPKSAFPTTMWIMNDRKWIHPKSGKFVEAHIDVHGTTPKEVMSSTCYQLVSEVCNEQNGWGSGAWNISPVLGGGYELILLSKGKGGPDRSGWSVQADMWDHVIPAGKNQQRRDANSRYVHIRPRRVKAPRWYIEFAP